ncbi:Uncharacterised protein [uncultured archaeon]|nr:Uncharacterised protein [uncultured archaeon]
MPKMWGVYKMELMKVCYEDPHGVLGVFCVLFIIIIAVASLIAILISSAGINVGNINIWTSVFGYSISAVFGFALGGNLKRKSHK